MESSGLSLGATGCHPQDHPCEVMSRLKRGAGLAAFGHLVYRVETTALRKKESPEDFSSRLATLTPLPALVTLILPDK